MNDLHYVEISILKELLFKPQAKFSQLKFDKKMENSQLNYHLEKLISSKIVQKVNDNYSLTNLGKEVANRMDTDSKIVKKQAKISVWVCPRREVNGVKEYLVYTRLKHPFYGSQGFLAGKLDYGEKVELGAERELFEETGLKGNAKLVAIKHYIVFDKITGTLVEDKFFFLCVVNNPIGVINSNEEGIYEWINQSQFKEKITNHFESYDAFLDQIGLVENFNGNIKFLEEEHYTEKF